ncbi:MAG: glycoside hydrolase family 16 protein [Acholeplasmataceae bacterium]|nr:MAG: glycoside hydrolase family 16 protein [Acholeplasmataceae bacterium]
MFIILSLPVLASCQQGVPNGLLPLSPVEDCAVGTLEGGWVCIWADEFDGDEIDSEKWNFQTGGGGWGNNELQYYRPENATVSDGRLIITAKKESHMGRQYTSARMTTKYRGDWQYMRIQVSAKMPGGRGTWPAIWMMPTMNVYGGWPNSGEIDILEYVGYDPDKIHTAIHTQKFNHKIGTHLFYTKTLADVETTFHVYEMIWSPGRLEMRVNDELFGVFAYTPVFNQEVPYHAAFPFDQLFYLILNVAIGGDWGGREGVDDNMFPTSMEVEYVRVYQLDYATLDKETPSTPANIQLAQLPNTLFWTPSTDDVGVEKYAIYVDGDFRQYASLNQARLIGLNVGQTYSIQIQAVDFVGRRSGKSDSFLLTIV